ncbi:hypothetical protein J6590_038133 [Homalodisca vitripennis]|nr:hypothetical protein J6590_038133 [Homalodisca vitripennis]
MYCVKVTTSVYMCLFIYWRDSKWGPIQNTGGKLSKFLTVVVRKCNALRSLPQSTCVCSFTGVILNGDQSRILMGTLSKFLTVVVQKCTALRSLPQSTCVCSFTGLIQMGTNPEYRWQVEQVSHSFSAEMYCGMVTTSVYTCLFIYWRDSNGDQSRILMAS